MCSQVTDCESTPIQLAGGTPCSQSCAVEQDNLPKKICRTGDLNAATAFLITCRGPLMQKIASPL